MDRSANPVAARLTRGSRPPSLHVSILLAIGIFIATTAVHVLELRDLPQTPLSALPNVTPGGILQQVAVAAMLVAPVITALSAAVLTHREARREECEPPHAPDVAGQVVVCGYLLTTLYRLRLLLAVLFGLAPSVVLGTAAFLSRLIAREVLNYSSELNRWAAAFEVPNNDYLGPNVVVMLVITIGLWGVCFLGGALGVRRGLRASSTVTAVVPVLITMLLLSSLVFAGLVLMLSGLTVLESPLWVFNSDDPDVSPLEYADAVRGRTRNLVLFGAVMLTVSCTALPLLLAFSLMRSASSLVRSAKD